MEINNKENILTMWISWHFVEVPKFLLVVWNNYILFALNYFSLPILLKSLFAPWRKYRWNYPKGFNIGEVLSTFASNVFSRFMGALVRIVLIIIGIIFQILVVLAGLLIFLLWIFIPLIIIAGFLFIFIY